MSGQELAPEDLSWVVRRLPDDVKAQLRARGKAVFVAGGFIRACIAREEVQDIDLFVANGSEAVSLADALASKHILERIPTDNAITLINALYPPYQIVHRWTFAEPTDIVSAFDFTIAAAAVWYDCDYHGWKSACDPRFYTDLAAKRLVYRLTASNTDTGGSMLRMLKFYARGYTAPLTTISQITARLCVNAKIGEDEAVMAEQIVAHLEEVDPQDVLPAVRK